MAVINWKKEVACEVQKRTLLSAFKENAIYMLYRPSYSRDTQLSRYIKGLPVVCKKHGVHALWNISTLRVTLHCGICAQEASKRAKSKVPPLTKRLRDAKQNGAEFLLTEIFIEKLYEKQDHKCALSGQVFSSLNEVSIDRVDSKKGYTEDNVQLVLYAFNRMKSDFTAEEFYSMCAQVVSWNGGH